MSEYGADKNADLNKTKVLAFDQGFLPVDDGNVMQWTYNNHVVRKLARKSGKTNILFKLEN